MRCALLDKVTGWVLWLRTPSRILQLDGLKTVLCRWAGSLSGLPLRWDFRLCSTIGQGHLLSSLPGGGRKLGLIIRQGHRLCFATGQGCRAGSTAGQEYGLGSKGAQAHCSGCLVMQGQRLYFTAHNRAAAPTPCPSRAVGRALQLHGFFCQASWAGRTGG